MISPTIYNFFVCKVEYGGQGLSLKYNVAVNEELGACASMSIPMAVSVQSDMSTPALARYIRKKKKQSIWQIVFLMGVSKLFQVRQRGAQAQLPGPRAGGRHGDQHSGQRAWGGVGRGSGQNRSKVKHYVSFPRKLSIKKCFKILKYFRQRRSGGDLVLNGEKMWITNGMQVTKLQPFLFDIFYC